MGLGGAKFRLPALISVFRLGIRKPYHDTVEVALAHLDAGKQIKRVVDAIRAMPEETAQKLRELYQKKAMTIKGLKILRAGKPDAYEKAGAALHQDTQAAWEDTIYGDPEGF